MVLAEMSLGQAVRHGARIALLSLGEETGMKPSALEECSPEWHLRGESCPHGNVAEPLHATAFTVPLEPGALDCVAMLYSMMPFLALFAVLIYLGVKRSSTAVLGFVFWLYMKAVADRSEDIGVFFSLGDFQRPALSCKWSCGMPSGHSVQATAFLMWVYLEVTLSRSLSSGQKMARLGAASALALPIYWSRFQLHDHTLLQLFWGVPLGVVLAGVWYLFLNLPHVSWLRCTLFNSRFWHGIGGVDDYEPNHYSIWAERDRLVPKETSATASKQAERGAIA